MTTKLPNTTGLVQFIRGFDKNKTRFENQVIETNKFLSNVPKSKIQGGENDCSSQGGRGEDRTDS